jgi:hypothetical protein
MDDKIRQQINNFVLLHDKVQKHFRVKILMDNVPCFNQKLQEIYLNEDFFKFNTSTGIGLFAHKHGFHVAENPTNRSSKIFLLQRYCTGDSIPDPLNYYIPNVSEYELITSLNNLKTMRNIILGQQGGDDKRSTILKFVSSINQKENEFVEISSLMPSQKSQIFQITKSVFFKGLSQIDSSFIQNRNLATFVRNKDKIEIQFPYAKTILRFNKTIEIENKNYISIEKIYQLNKNIKTLDYDNTGIFLGKKIYTDNINTMSSGEVISSLQFLFALDPKPLLEGNWKFTPKRLVLPSSYRFYNSSLRSAIPKPVLNSLDFEHFKSACSDDLKILNFNKKRQSSLNSFVRSKGFFYYGVLKDLCASSLHKELTDLLSKKTIVKYSEITSEGKRNYLLMLMIEIFASIYSEESSSGVTVIDALDRLHFKVKNEIIQGVNAVTIEISQKTDSGEFRPVFSSSVRR